MGSVTAVKMDVVTTKSGHQVTGMAVSPCITPMAPSPMPVPYPTMGMTAEGLLMTPMRTKVQGSPVLNVGGVVKSCHGNEAGTLKEVVSLYTSGGTYPMIGAPIVYVERGMMGITTSTGVMNTMHIGAGSATAGSAASGAPVNASGDAAAPPAPPAPAAPPPPAGSPTGGGSSGSSSSSGGGGAGSGGGGGGDPPVNDDHRKKAAGLLGGRVTPEDVALAEAPNRTNPPSADQIRARKRVLNAFYKEHGKEFSHKDENGKPYGTDASGKTIKKVRDQTLDERRSQKGGTDFNHPVSVGPPPPCPGTVHQQQVPGNDRGTYFGPKGQSADQSGIAPEGKAWNQPGQPVVPKQEKAHQVDSDTPYLNSTCRKTDDTWSVPGKSQPASGGGQQYYVPSAADPSSPKVH